MISSCHSQREAKPQSGRASPHAHLSLALLSLIPATACSTAGESRTANDPDSSAYQDDPLRVGMHRISNAPGAPMGPQPLPSPDPDPARRSSGRDPENDSLLRDAWSGIENSWLNVVRVIDDPEELKRFAGKQALRYLRRLARSQEGDGYQVEPQLTFRLGAGEAEPRSWETDQMLHPTTFRGGGSRAYPDGLMPIRVGIGTDEIFNQSRSVGFRFDISSVDFDWKHFEIDRICFKPALRWNNFTIAAEISTDDSYGFAFQHQITW